MKANKHILDISTLRGENGTYFGTDKLKQQFENENCNMLLTQGIRIKGDPNLTMPDGTLPPLSHLATPEGSKRMNTHTDQFFDSDMKQSKMSASNATSPKYAKDRDSEILSLRDSMKARQNSYNAEAAKKIEEAKEAVFERIMHSANIVKEVLQRNMSLSEDIVKNNEIIDNLNQDIFQLQRENEDLRERLEILETITGKDSSILLGKLRNANQTMDPDEQDDTIETENRKPREEMKEFGEKELMVLLTDEYNSDDFMIKNKQSIINAIYQLGKDKQILVKRIENLEKSRIRKTHMKLRMTNNGFYKGDENGKSFSKALIAGSNLHLLIVNEDLGYNTNYNEQTADQIRFKATLDEGVDDIEPIRSILNEDDLIVVRNNQQQQIRKGKNKLKITKQTSYNDKRILPLK